MLVFVRNKHGESLMPCDSRKARLLLKKKIVKIIKRTPFTIQYLYGTSGYKQSVSLGVDAGYKHIGLSATTEKKVLFEAEIELRNDIVNLLSTRRMMRRSRRSRKTRYRAPRFDNRKKKDGWLAPSVENKITQHLKAIALVHELLPIAKVTIEVAQFDIQKIKNPNISGIEYQKGNQLGFWNVREYVLWRDSHKCRGRKNCKNKILNVHHKESRKTGGNSPENLITLCEECHHDYHAGKLNLNLHRGQPFKAEIFMSIMRWTVYNRLKKLYPNISITYGYVTKNTRINAGLEKGHQVDARCISGYPNAEPGSSWYFFKQVRGQNRQLHKINPIKSGVRKANKASQYLFGFQLFDRVLFDRHECFIFARRVRGYFDIRTLDGVRVSKTSYKNLKLLERANTLLCERRCNCSLLTRTQTNRRQPV